MQCNNAYNRARILFLIHTHTHVHRHVRANAYGQTHAYRQFGCTILYVAHNSIMYMGIECTTYTCHNFVWVHRPRFEWYTCSAFHMHLCVCVYMCVCCMIVTVCMHQHWKKKQKRTTFLKKFSQSKCSINVNIIFSFIFFQFRNFIERKWRKQFGIVQRNYLIFQLHVCVCVC